MTRELAPGNEVNWKLWHSAGVLAVTGFFVWMAVWRPWGLYASWIVTMAALSAFTLIVGRGVTGAWKGAFVDERLRVSLSQLQMIVWTIVIVAALGTMAIARAQVNPATAMDIQVPETIWMLLGISTTSLVGSPLIKNIKKYTPTNRAHADSLVEAQGADAAAVTIQGQIVMNKSIHQASLADVFMGEAVDNFTLLDVGKMQMFFFTVVLVLAYTTTISAQMRAGSLAALPDVGSGLLPLLGISHAGYLLSKVASSSAAAAHT
jgi:hypothetical protein